MWIKMSESNRLSVGSSEVLAVNTTTAKALLLTETQEGFRLELETPIGLGEHISRHLALLGVFKTSEYIKQKVDEFLAKSPEGFFEL